MASVAPSDTESNLSGFIRYNESSAKSLYISMIESMEMISQSQLQIEKNMKNIVNQAGPLENQLSALLQSLPKHNFNITMDTD